MTTLLPRDPDRHVPPPRQTPLIERLRAPSLHLGLDSHLSSLLHQAAGRLETLEAVLRDVDRVVRGVRPPEPR